MIAAHISPARSPLRRFIAPHTYPAHTQPAARDIRDIAPAVSGGRERTYMTPEKSARNAPETNIPHTAANKYAPVLFIASFNCLLADKAITPYNICTVWQRYVLYICQNTVFYCNFTSILYAQCLTIRYIGCIILLCIGSSAKRRLTLFCTFAYDFRRNI